MKKLALFLFFLFVTYVHLYAQMFRHFSTAELEHKVYNESSDFKKIKEKEIEFDKYLNDEFLQKEGMKPITLPLVFHIILPDTNIVNKLQIEKQIIALNDAFSNKIVMPDDDYYRDYAVDTEIRFCVPNFNEKYIHFKSIPANYKFNNLFEIKSEEIGLEPLKPEKYINIWIADLGDTLISGQKFSLAGYSQLPMRDNKSDGIVIDVDYFGKFPENEEYSEGYTLVHLMGTYLGLKPLTGFSECEGDGIEDTPDINVESLICWEQNEINHVASGCSPNVRRMTRNFMDNIPDECAAMFTYGQKVRMQGMLGLKGARYSSYDETLIGCEKKLYKQLNTIENSVQSNIIIYPNPSKYKITVECINFSSNIAQKFEITNILGQTLKTGEILPHLEIGIKDWPQGTYFFIAKSKNSAPVKRSFEVLR